jgi:cytochrome c biogenesis protein CcdA
MGVFSGFSPCLMAMLGFILSYTAGASRGLRDGMGRAMVFGMGLVTAYILLGVCMLAFGKSLVGVGAMSMIAGIVSILIGLNMLGVLKTPVTLDGYVKRSAKKHAGNMVGLFFLGVLFSMVKVPCAAPFLLVLTSEMLATTSLNSVFILLAFSVGVLTPFMVIGLVGGYALSERVRSYKDYIRMVSGIIIIILGVWIMV